jgi:hypothetical protein
LARGGLTIPACMVDKGIMNEQPNTHRSRQIVGISLPPAVATAFKEEAARRNISLRSLFEEMWQGYGDKTK